MATYNVPTGTKSTLWQGGVRVQSGATIVKVTDDNDSNLEFTVGEVIKITYGNGQTHEGNYRGTITIDGVKYPVIQFWTGTFHYAVGTGNPSSAPQHLQPALTAETFTVCFFPGTLIATPSGERRVENLVSGDLVLIWNSCRSFGTADRANAPQDAGSARAVPIKWIGRQTVSTRFGPAERLMPVRFAAGSLRGGGGGQPSAA